MPTVPQGTILGPILITLAINRLLLSFFDNSFAYAEDTLLFCEATSVPEDLEISHTLLKDASQWYNSHLLRLGIQKTQSCIFSNRSLKYYYNLNFQNTKMNHNSQSMSYLSIYPHCKVGYNTNSIILHIKSCKKQSFQAYP